MSDDDQAHFSDLEGSVVDQKFAEEIDNKTGELYDPTGQYANAYARAGKPISKSSPTANSSITPQQHVPKHPHQSGNRVRFAEPPHTYQESIVSSSQDAIAFSHQSGHREHSQLYNESRKYREPGHQARPAVARVVSRHTIPARYNRTRLEADIAEDEPLAEPLYQQPLHEPLYEQPPHHFASSSQYSFQSGDADESEHTSPRFVPRSPFASGPLSSSTTSPFAPPAKRVSHHHSFTTQPNFPDFEQSPTPPSYGQQYQEPHHEGRTSSQEFIPNDDRYMPAEEYLSMPRQAKRSYESMDDDSESGIFVKVSGHRVVPAGGAGSGSNPPKARKRFSHDNLLTYDNSGPPPRPGQRPDNEYFNNPGKNLAESRFAGGQNNWGVNKIPVLVPEDEVSDAALLKRGLRRGDGAKVCKRGYGANDPENIAIVNMFEKDRMSFEAICNKLNADRIANGKAPTLTPNGCQTRFNRNAPILFSAEGKEFITLGMRRRGQRMDEIPPSAPRAKVAWDEELDMALVETVKEWESRKWEDVAALFKLKTGVDMDSGSCAHRHHII